MKCIFRFSLLFAFCFLMSTCKEPHTESESVPPKQHVSTATIIVLGTIQDGGSPHAGCKKACCQSLFNHPDTNRKVVCLGLLDYKYKQTWMLEATPDISTQMKELKTFAGFSDKETPDGIFLTHAHIGHYTGLMQLGREVMNAKGVQVFTMPRMKTFLETNGPWSQLVTLHNIELNELKENEGKSLSPNFTVSAFTVPHRDEFSETVGYIIKGPHKSALFIPDIDKWEKWNKSIIDEIKKVDFAFLDATFYSGEEINNRNIKEIPHPFVLESMELFKSLSAKEKAKIYFIHFNHTNPLLIQESEATTKLKAAGFNVAEKGMKFDL
ncbi:MAG: MBL fold metallo-hydrolase [Bacteroidia bacterium]|nr:MBL fold metallo-hydrolase [Bacteroidia bacterium]